MAKENGNGRKANGRFGKGNKVGRGGIMGKPCSETKHLRGLMYDALRQAKGGAEGTVAKVLADSPGDFIKTLAKLEPKDVRVETQLKQVVMIMLPAPPPPDWEPPIDMDLERHLPGGG